MATLETQYKNFLKNNPKTDLPFEEWKKVNARLIKQALINMMKDDEELGLYDEPTKCYCSHTVTCDCEPEEPKQETLEEAAERLAKHFNIDFIAGANWQQENLNINALDFEIDTLKKEIKLLKYQQEQFSKSEFLQKLRATLSDAEARRLISEQFKKK